MSSVFETASGIPQITAKGGRDRTNGDGTEYTANKGAASDVLRERDLLP